METLDRNYVNIEDEMRRSYLDYAMSVIIGRALPDVRDGFKPVHRRVLWAMHELGNQHNKAYKKSARIVGDVIGKYHPHGDSAVYETIVRMAQEFSLRYPLVDGQGNFGSIDGDSAAAMRYTEARMSKIAAEVLADIEKETVNFQPNYDESLSEPAVMPTRVPNLLLNGSEGIAVGMATKIPPHNLTEIVEATIALIKKPTMKEAELLALVPGPDFPTAGFIYGREGIRSAYTTGRGIIQMRARAGIDRIGRGTTERDAIIITEIPFQVNKARLIERIAELVNEKKIDGIADMRDESSRDGMRVVIELKRDAVPQIVLNKLYKLTPMQSTFGVINLAIVDGQPRVLTLRQMLDYFIEFRREVVRRRTEYDLRKAKARAHILEGLNKAIDALDYIIPLIRNARSVDEARQWLTGNGAAMTEVKQWKGVPSDVTVAGFIDKLRKVMKRLDFSEAQAQAILDLQLRRLSALERQKIIDEYEQIIKLIAELEDILSNEASLRRVIVKELEDVKKDFGDARRTQIIDEGVELSIEDMIADEDVAITVTKNGYVKRTAVSTYQRQGRGGKGRSGASTGKNEDWVEHLFIASTHSYLMIFTDDGQVYKLKVHEIPDALPSARGKAVVNLINIPSSRKLAGVIPVREFSEGRYVVMVTKNGVIKKTELSEFQNIRSNGINAVNVDEGDELLDVMLTDGTKRIFIATHDGLAIRFDESDVRPMGRAARGVRGIDLRKGDYVVSVAPVSADDSEKMLSVSECGFGKQTPITTYRLQSRGGKGRSGASTGKNEDWVEHLFIASTHSYLMIFTDDGQVYKLKVHEIPDALPSARGKAVVNLINIPSSRKLAGVIPVREFSEGRYVVMVTKNGVIKKTELSEFQNIRSNGINAVNVDEGDELLDVMLTDGTKRIFIATHDGLAIRFDESDVRPMGRAARGVRGIDLRKGDYVVSVAPVSADDSEKMLSVSECGFGKQTPITTYRLQSRGGKGVINMKTTDKTGKVVAVFPVDEESELMIITKQGKLIRIEAGEIRKTGRGAQGVRLIKTDGGDKVTSASLLDATAQAAAVEA